MFEMKGAETGNVHGSSLQYTVTNDVGEGISYLFCRDLCHGAFSFHGSENTKRSGR